MILNKHASEIRAEFGVDAKDHGVHSLRKGAAIYTSSGYAYTPLKLPPIFVQIGQWDLSKISISDLKLRETSVWVGLLLDSQFACRNLM